MLQFFLVHPGGPLWARKDEGAWSIPKGEFDGEPALEAAVREFKEETGFGVSGTFIALPPVTLASGKRVYAWAVEGDLDAGAIRSNTFEMEWPPKSGRVRTFPEADRGAWFGVEDALVRINPAQRAFIEEVIAQTP